MAGRPKRRARLAAEAAARAAAAQPAPPTPRPVALPAPPPGPDPKVVALAGAVLLGRERHAIHASGRPLAASMAILDQHLPTYINEVQRRLEDV